MWGKKKWGRDLEVACSLHAGCERVDDAFGRPREGIDGQHDIFEAFEF